MKLRMNSWRCRPPTVLIFYFLNLVIYRGEHTNIINEKTSWFRVIKPYRVINIRKYKIYIKADFFFRIVVKHIQKEIKSRLKLGNACYHSVQKLLSSSLLSKNLKIKIYRTIILPFVLKLGRWNWRRNIGWECLRTGCWGEYLGLRGMW